MFSLIMVLVAISLLAYVWFAGISYLPASMTTSAQVHLLAQTGFSWFAGIYHTYQEVYGEPPAPTEDGAPVFSVAYGLLPAAPAGTDWRYGEVDGSHWFCLDGVMTETQYNGIQRLAQSASGDRYLISDSCGATSPGDVPSAFPAHIAMTYWMTPPSL